MAQQAPPGSLQLKIGCAGWSLPRDSSVEFPDAGTHLQRYAGRLHATEINSSFYRPHQKLTYERWGAATPTGFRFSVKLPKTITHEQRLARSGALLDSFMAQVMGLGGKLSCLLVQLPPSLSMDLGVAPLFFKTLRARYPGAVALEPRHASWFTSEAEALLQHWRIARVLADPVLHDAGRWPGGWPGLVYCRLHGSPRIYYSRYDSATLQALADRLALAGRDGAAVWCMFDNTASGAATHNALELTRRVSGA